MQQTALAHAADQEEHGETQGGHLVSSENTEFSLIKVSDWPIEANGG